MLGKLFARKCGRFGSRGHHAGRYGRRRRGGHRLHRGHRRREPRGGIRLPLRQRGIGRLQPDRGVRNGRAVLRLSRVGQPCGGLRVHRDALLPHDVHRRGAISRSRCRCARARWWRRSSGLPFCWVAVFTLMACALASLAMLAITDGDGDMVSVVLSLLGGWSALTGNCGVASSIMGVANALVSAAYTVGLAFLSLTLGAWWARRHKVAAAVALYVGIGWVISLLFSIVGVLAMVGDTGTASFMLGVVSVMQTVVNLAVAVAVSPCPPTSCAPRST